MIDWLKGKLLDVPDRLNRKVHAREEFTRPAFIVDDRLLSYKAALIWKDIQAKWRHGADGEFYQYADPFDGGDSAYHHGWYTAACALKHDGKALKLAIAGLEKFVYTSKLDRLCRGVDIIDGKMKVGDPSRTYYEREGMVFHQNCSESSLIGILTAIFFIRLASPDAQVKLRISILIDRLARRVIADGYRLLNEDGSPAKHGDLRPGLTAAPIRIGTLASLLLLAYDLTGDTEYQDRYECLATGNLGALTHQETHVLWIYPWYQTILAYQNYTILAALDPKRGATFKRSLELLWERTNHEGNPLYTYLAHLTLGSVPEEYLDQAKKALDEVSAEEKFGRTGKDPGAVDLTGSQWDTGFRWGPKWLRGGKLESRQPVPVSLRPAADFFPQRNPYSLVGHSGHRYNALDFCLEYYLGSFQGVL